MPAIGDRAIEQLRSSGQSGASAGVIKINNRQMASHKLHIVQPKDHSLAGRDVSLVQAPPQIPPS